MSRFATLCMLGVVGLIGLWSACAGAADGNPRAVSEAPLCDPCVPAAARNAAQAAPALRGEALQAQVRAKLRASFDAADVEHRGSLTREQARTAGLRFIATHFDRIDVAHRSRVSFDDVVAYLRSRGGAL